MKIEDLAETDVLSFYLDQRHAFLELAVVASGGARFKMQARNHDGSPIGVEFGQVHFRGNFSTAENLPSLGELESVGVTDNGIILEGDFGDITIHADCVEVIEQ